MERERVQLHMVPVRHLTTRQAGCTAPLRLGGEHAQRLAQLARLNASADADRTEVMAVEFFRQPPEDRVLWIGGDPLHDELSACNAECERWAVFEQAIGPPHHRVHGGTEGRVAIGVHRVPLQSHRKRDQILTELVRQLRAL
jgi:hypothetical protein